MDAYWLGRADYESTWALQERLRQRVLAGGPEVLLLCEHPPVLTLGKSAAAAEVTTEAATLSAHGVAIVRSSRGGKVTYHGPGQLVVYPIVRLRQGLVHYIEALAGAAVAVAARLGIAARFERERVGVFVGARKLAAIGVHVTRRVTIHGMALNVTAEATAAFRQGWFLPCGELGGQVTSLAEERAQLARHAADEPTLTVESVGRALRVELTARLGALPRDLPGDVPNGLFDDLPGDLPDRLPDDLTGGLPDEPTR